MNCDASQQLLRNVGNWVGSGYLGSSIRIRNDWGMVPDPADACLTVIRDGNYDFLTNSQRWHNNTGGFTASPTAGTHSDSGVLGSNPVAVGHPATGTTTTLPPRRGMTPHPHHGSEPEQLLGAVTASPSNGGTVAVGGTLRGQSDTVTGDSQQRSTSSTGPRTARGPAPGELHLAR